MTAFDESIAAFVSRMHARRQAEIAGSGAQVAPDQSRGRAVHKTLQAILLTWRHDFAPGIETLKHKGVVCSEESSGTDAAGQLAGIGRPGAKVIIRASNEAISYRGAARVAQITAHTIMPFNLIFSPGDSAGEIRLRYSDMRDDLLAEAVFPALTNPSAEDFSALLKSFVSLLQAR